MGIYMKIGIVGAIIIAAAIILTLYIVIYNKQLNKRSKVKIKLIDPYQLLITVIVLVITSVTFVFAVPKGRTSSPNNDQNSGGVGGGDIQDPRTDYDSEKDDTGFDYPIKIFINIQNLKKEQKDQLDEEIANSGYRVQVVYLGSNSNLGDDLKYDIVVTNDKITTNLYFDSYQIKKDKIENLISIIERVFSE